MWNGRLFIALTAIILTSWNCFAQATGNAAQLQFIRTAKTSEETLPQESISIQSQEAEIIQQHTTGERLVVKVLGKFSPARQGLNLTCPSVGVCPNSQIIVRPSDGAFAVYFIVKSLLSEVWLAAIDETGKTEYARFIVKVTSGWSPAPTIIEKTTIKAPSFGILSIGFGGTYSQYLETNSSLAFTTVNQNQIGLVGRIGYNFKIGDALTSRWSGQFFTYITALPLSMTYTPPMRFLGVNLRVGYDFTRSPNPIVFSLFWGFSYLTTFVQSSEYGYSNIVAPQLYPAIAYNFGNKQVIRFYVKFSPVNGDGGFFNVGVNREWSVGSSYQFLIGKSFPINLNLDFADLRATSTQFDNTSAFTSQSISFGVGVPIEGLF